jgi:class 3 adenylate cyclase
VRFVAAGCGSVSGQYRRGDRGHHRRRRKLEFTLIGDTVNVVARVEQLTKTTGDTTLLTQQTIDALVSRPTQLTDRGSHELKGKSAAIQVFALGQDHMTEST